MFSTTTAKKWTGILTADSGLEHLLLLHGDSILGERELAEAELEVEVEVIEEIEEIAETEESAALPLVEATAPPRLVAETTLLARMIVVIETVVTEIGTTMIADALAAQLTANVIGTTVDPVTTTATAPQTETTGKVRTLPATM